METLSDYGHIDLINVSSSALVFENGLKIFPQQHKVMLGEKELELSKNEYGVLWFLAQRPGWIFSKEQIYEAVWNENSDSYFNAVTNTISRLRKKLETNMGQVECIQTIPGHGYKFSLKYLQEE